jgi:hypothetical protein
MGHTVMNIDEIQTEAEKILDQYETSGGLIQFGAFDSSEVEKYFHLSMAQLNKLGGMECANASYMLAQYSFHLQRLYNRESAKNRWAQDQITKAVCDKLDDYSTYTKYDAKIALVAKENTAVEKLQAIVSYSGQTMERLNFLSTSVKNMCEIMSNLQRAKAFQQKAGQYEY